MEKRGKSEMLLVCHKIAARQLLEHKMISVCMIAAVMLTTVLFTTAFSAAFYFRDSIRQAEMEHAAWKAHAAIQDVSDKQYADMQSYEGVSDISSYIHLGFLEEGVQDEVVEMQYCEDRMAEWMYYGLLWGHMPKTKQEIAVSTQLLESKGIPQESGAEISIQYTVNGVLKEGMFTVSGVYEQKPTSAEVVFVSEEFCRQALEEASVDPVRDSVLGVRVVEVMFTDTSHLQRDMERFVEQTGVSRNKWILNPAFEGGGRMEPGTVMALVGVLLMIMACGYFIIYNICTISIMQDTRFYGSLAMLGFLESEIKKIVKIKTDLLCVIAIPVGFFPGYLLSIAFLPEIMKSFGSLEMQSAPNPIVFVCAAVFSFLTVKISSRKPAAMAAKMQPVAAKRYVAAGTGKGRVSRHGQKTAVMAWKNMIRDRKKSLFICCSLMLCMILSAMFYTISSGLNLDIFLQDAISSDFIVGSTQYFNQVGNSQAPPAVDSSLIEAAGQWEGVEACGGACVTSMDVPLDSGAYAAYQEIVGEDDRYKDGLMHDTMVYGIDEYLFRKMDVKAGSVDWEKFLTGDYVMTSGFVQAEGKESCFQPGDTVELVFGGHSREYTVMAVGDIPYDCSVRFRNADSVELYLPMQEWTAQMQSQDYYMYAFDVDDAYEAQWEENMAALKQGAADFSYASRMMFRGQFEGLASGIQILGVSISAILAVIGLMNFINVIYSSIYNRRRELAVMQSIGMDTGQVYGMLSAEGGYYILASWLGGIAFGFPLVYFVVSALENQMQFFQYQFRLLPYILFGAVGGILAVSVPCIIFHALNRREDLLYRLRHD